MTNMNVFALFYLKRFLTSARKAWLRFDTLLTGLGIVISVAALIVTFAIFRGYETALKNVILGANSHAYIFKYGPNGVCAADLDTLATYFATRPEVETFAGLMSTQAMTGQGKRQRGVMLRGIDTRASAFTTRYPEYVREGRYVLNNDDEAVVGASLARDIGLGLGDTLRIVSPLNARAGLTRLFGLQQHSFVIVGLYRSGMYEFDSRLVVVSPQAARPFCATPGDYTWVEVKLRPDAIDKADLLAERWGRDLGERYQIHSWIFFNEELFALITLEKWILFIILSFLVLIASFNVVSSVSTDIIEKRREIGIMKAFGVPGRTLRQIFLGRAVVAGALCVLTGEGLGWLVAQVLVHQNLYQLKGDVYLLDRIQVRFDAQTWLLTFGVSLFIITVAAILPLRRINRLHVIDVVRGN